MRSRCTLHKSRLEDFRHFCESRGWVQEPTKSEYEVLRMRHPDRVVPMLVHRREGAQEHYTTWGESSRMVNIWLNEREQ